MEKNWESRNPEIYNELIFNKYARQFNRERRVFSTSDVGTNRSHMQKNKVGPLPNNIYNN